MWTPLVKIVTRRTRCMGPKKKKNRVEKGRSNASGWWVPLPSYATNSPDRVVNVTGLYQGGVDSNG